VSIPSFMSVRGEDIELRLKAVPGAKRDEIAGALGDRLKVRVAQPPEGGRANEAICELLASRLGLSVRDIEIVQGATNPQKTVRVCGQGSGGGAPRRPPRTSRHVPGTISDVAAAERLDARLSECNAPRGGGAR